MGVSKEIDRNKETSFLVINMTGSEFQIIPESDDGVYFDYRSIGFRIRTEWVAVPILVHDIDGNGIIDNGNKLFADNTVLEDGEFADNGFLALRELCDTKDGIFDKRSAAYSEVYIWLDTNGNGISDVGELQSISDIGIISIDTNYTVVDYVDGEENKLRHVSTATLDDGEVVEVAEVLLSYTTRETKAIYEVEVSDEVKDLPQIRGLGTNYSLHQAMMIDESGELQKLVEQFASEPNESVRRELTKKILYKWSNTTTKVGVMKAFTGFFYSDDTDFDMEIINNSFDRGFVNIYYEALMTQSHYRYLYRKMDMDNIGSEGIGFTLVADELLEGIEMDRAVGDELLKNYIYNVLMLDFGKDTDKTTFQDKIEGADVRGAIYIKMLESSVLKDVYEHRGLSGTEEDDIFLISASDNTIEDIKGDDIYIFGLYSGDNTIIDIDGDNTILLSIMPDEFKATLVQSDMELKVGDNTIIIKDFENADSYSVVFLDGSMIEI